MTSLNLQQKSELRWLSREVNPTDALLMLSTFPVIGCLLHTSHFQVQALKS